MLDRLQADSTIEPQISRKTFTPLKEDPSKASLTASFVSSASFRNIGDEFFFCLSLTQVLKSVMAARANNFNNCEIRIVYIFRNKNVQNEKGL